MTKLVLLIPFLVAGCRLGEAPRIDGASVVDGEQAVDGEIAVEVDHDSVFVVATVLEELLEAARLACRGPLTGGCVLHPSGATPPRESPLAQVRVESFRDGVIVPCASEEQARVREVIARLGSAAR